MIVGPGEAGVAAGVVDGRQEVREDRVGRRRGGEVLALLPVVAQADVGGEVADGDSVSWSVGAGVLGLDLGAGVAG